MVEEAMAAATSNREVMEVTKEEAAAATADTNLPRDPLPHTMEATAAAVAAATTRLPVPLRVRVATAITRHRPTRTRTRATSEGMHPPPILRLRASTYTATLSIPATREDPICQR